MRHQFLFLGFIIHYKIGWFIFSLICLYYFQDQYGSVKIVCNYANILMLLSAQNVFKCFIINFINIISLFNDL